jgi:hypothetical protein
MMVQSSRRRFDHLDVKPENTWQPVQKHSKPVKHSLDISTLDNKLHYKVQ